MEHNMVNKQEFIKKACEWLEENIDLIAMDIVDARSRRHEIVMMNDFEGKFREAMEEYLWNHIFIVNTVE